MKMYENNGVLHDWENNTGEIFSLRVAVLARSQGGTILNLRTDTPMYQKDLHRIPRIPEESVITCFIWTSMLASTYSFLVGSNIL